MKHLLVFTDLDGTLLNHHDYSWDAAIPALKMLEEQGVPLILNTSKTYSEVRQFREDLGNQHPFIVENGSAVYAPSGYFTPGAEPSSENFEIVYFGPVRRNILKLINRLRAEKGYQFQGFDEMTPEQLAEITGLSREGAIKAKQRDCSEPLVWQDSEAALELFRADLQEEELTLLKGGRFLHVMGTTDKANGVHWLAERFHEVWPEHEYVSVGLGDSPNDIGMLEAVDIPVVIEMASGESLQLEHKNEIIYPGIQGPEGWCVAVMQILEKFNGKN